MRCGVRAILSEAWSHESTLGWNSSVPHTQLPYCVTRSEPQVGRGTCLPPASKRDLSISTPVSSRHEAVHRPAAVPGLGFGAHTPCCGNRDRRQLVPLKVPSRRESIEVVGGLHGAGLCKATQHCTHQVLTYTCSPSILMWLQEDQVQGHPLLQTELGPD